ncbi:MAG: PEGA domain-containing protein [Methanoregula sp.]|nr:PEGA domain-containing protein [Methanoregula sp.]
MKRFPFIICLVFLFLLALAGFVSADSPETTATTPENTGGYIFFETSPTGATIWLDNVNIGTSPFTYHSDKTGAVEVRVQKKLFEDYTRTVTVIEGERVFFRAQLSPVPSVTMDPATPAVVVTTATITKKDSAVTVPTPWPTATPESPTDPAVVIGAAAAGIGFFAIRRR